MASVHQGLESGGWPLGLLQPQPAQNLVTMSLIEHLRQGSEKLCESSAPASQSFFSDKRMTLGKLISRSRCPTKRSKHGTDVQYDKLQQGRRPRGSSVLFWLLLRCNSERGGMEGEEEAVPSLGQALALERSSTSRSGSDENQLCISVLYESGSPKRDQE